MHAYEPALAFAGVQPHLATHAPIDITHYQAQDIARELRVLYDRAMPPDTPGQALFMSTEQTATLGTCLPSVTLNAVRPGEAQRLHRHNAAAIMLSLCEAGCASAIGGGVFPWTQYVTLPTPAGAAHRHHNPLRPGGDVRDDDIALALIVQDGGFYYYGRTMGFAFTGAG